MLKELFNRYLCWTGEPYLCASARGKDSSLEDSMTKTPLASSAKIKPTDVPHFDSPRGSPAEDALAACFILSIVGGFLPGVFFDASLLFSLIGAGSGLLLGLLMAYE